MLRFGNGGAFTLVWVRRDMEDDGSGQLGKEKWIARNFEEIREHLKHDLLCTTRWRRGTSSPREGVHRSKLCWISLPVLEVKIERNYHGATAILQSNRNSSIVNMERQKTQNCLSSQGFELTHTQSWTMKEKDSIVYRNLKNDLPAFIFQILLQRQGGSQGSKSKWMGTQAYDAIKTLSLMETWGEQEYEG